MMNLDFDKMDGLIPAIVQDAITKDVLMLGFMNRAALNKTIELKKLTFYSRSKKRLWTKGEKSGHFLNVHSITFDCDKDTILVQANPQGDTCHMGSYSCFGEMNSKGFLYKLQSIIEERVESKNIESYTYSLFEKGINKVAQKVGEEAVELVIESKDNNDKLFLNEAADLMYHFLILLRKKNVELEDVEKVLQKRHM